MLDRPTSTSDDGDGLLHRPPPPRTWRERLHTLADATGSSPARLVGGALVGLAGLVGALWLLRSPAPPPEASLPFASTTVTSVATASTSTMPTTLVVHVAGAVAVPDVYELPAGARVVDAIEAAGGLSPGADPARINLAAPVADGERVYAPALGEEPPPVPGGGSTAGAAPAATDVVNVNTADAAGLDALPGVGPAIAAAILEHRGKVGRFTSVEQLLDVPGIGESKLEALRDLVTV